MVADGRLVATLIFRLRLRCKRRVRARCASDVVPLGLGEAAAAAAAAAVETGVGRGEGDRLDTQTGQSHWSAAGGDGAGCRATVGGGRGGPSCAADSATQRRPGPARQSGGRTVEDHAP